MGIFTLWELGFMFAFPAGFGIVWAVVSILCWVKKCKNKKAEEARIRKMRDMATRPNKPVKSMMNESRVLQMLDELDALTVSHRKPVGRLIRCIDV